MAVKTGYVMVSTMEATKTAERTMETNRHARQWMHWEENMEEESGEARVVESTGGKGETTSGEEKVESMEEEEKVDGREHLEEEEKEREQKALQQIIRLIMAVVGKKVRARVEREVNAIPAVSQGI